MIIYYHKSFQTFIYILYKINKDRLIKFTYTIVNIWAL